MSTELSADYDEQLILRIFHWKIGPRLGSTPRASVLPCLIPQLYLLNVLSASDIPAVCGERLRY